MRAIDLTGQATGKITVIAYAGKKGRSRCWLCRCECGNYRIVSVGNIRSGHTQSCGCWQKQRASESNRRHLQTRTAEFNVWVKMRQRCTNPRSKDFGNYGARGISVCSRWDSFEVFLLDMGCRPSRHHTIERINNNLGYSPENCKWATRQEQNSNTRQNKVLTFNGKTMIAAEWARLIGVSPTVIHKRILRGGSKESVLRELAGGCE